MTCGVLSGAWRMSLRECHGATLEAWGTQLVRVLGRSFYLAPTTPIFLSTRSWELPSDSAIQYGEMHAMKSPRTQVFQSGRQSWLGYSWKRTSPGFLDKKMRSPLPYTISRCRWCDRTILRFEPHEEPRISVNLVHISYGDFLLRDRLDTR
jgi:hypothetical protein